MFLYCYRNRKCQKQNRETPDRNGMTPLHLATIMGQAANAQLLLDHGANSNALSAIGQTPLHQAVLRDNLRITEILLQNGAAVDRSDKEGRTPVDWAVIRNNEAMVDLLVSYGAHRPATLGVFGPAPATPPAAFDVTHLLGTIVTSATALPLMAEATGESAELSGGAAGAPLLPTRIKIIDILAPLVRGGQNGIFTPLSGVGHQVVIGQLIYKLSSHFDWAIQCAAGRSLRLCRHAGRSAGKGNYVGLIGYHRESSDSR